LEVRVLTPAAVGPVARCELDRKGEVKHANSCMIPGLRSAGRCDIDA
jgi:hypothetical protein